MTQPKYIVTEEVVRELVAALEPFADTADFCERMSDIDYEYVSVGNLRAARDAIAKARGETGENAG